MKKQSLLLVTAIALPLALLAVLGVRLASHPSANLHALEEKARNAKGHPVNLQEAIEHNRNLMALLEQTTQAQWDVESAQHPGLSSELDKARRAIKARLAYLGKITPEQWLAEKQQRQARLLRPAAPQATPVPSASTQ